MLHFLISAGCFDATALELLAAHSEHDVNSLAVTPFLPPLAAATHGGEVVKNQSQVLALRESAREHPEAGKLQEDKGEEGDEEAPETFSDLDDDEIGSYIHNGAKDAAA